MVFSYTISYFPGTQKVDEICLLMKMHISEYY